MAKNRTHNIQTLSKRTFQQDGKWILQPRRSKILLCECGNKYIKTRPRQNKCLYCTLHKLA